MGQGYDHERRQADLNHDDAESSPPDLHPAWTGPTGRAARAQADDIRRTVQMLGHGAGGSDVQQAAQRGVAGSGGPLPHRQRIQASFGRHDVSDVRAHIGGPAERAARSMNAQAYATDQDVAFARSPDLHTAAHEAAHVVQQRGGVSLKGGVGRSGDVYEQHADAIADAVVAGRSAEGLLDRHADGGGVTGAVQHKPDPSKEADSAETSDEKGDVANGAEKAADDGKTTFIVRWSGKFGGDLSAKVSIKSLGKKSKTVTKTVADADAGKGERSQVLEAKLSLKAAKRMRIEVDPTASAPEDRYRKTRRTVKLGDLGAKESRHEVSLKIKRTNEKNVVDVWEDRGIDPKKARHVHAQTLLGHRVQLNAAVKPTVEKTNAALAKLDADTQKSVTGSIIRIGGYNRRTTSKGTFSNHSIGCAIDVNYNGGTKQNHHFHKSHKADKRLLAFVQRVVRTDKALASFDIWKSKGQDQIKASQAFERLFPAYLRRLLGAKAPTVKVSPPEAETPAPAADAGAAPSEGTEAAAKELVAPIEVLDLTSVTPAIIGQVIKATKDKAAKAELRLIKSNLPSLKAWVVGAQVKGREMVGMVPLDEKLLQVMLDGGWGWGGDWSSAKDYMHFEDRGAMDSLKKGSDAPAAKK